MFAQGLLVSGRLFFAGLPLAQPPVFQNFGPLSGATACFPKYDLGKR